MTARLRYTTQLVFRDILGIEGVFLTNDWDKFSQKTDEARLIYAGKTLENVPTLYPSQLLFEQEITTQELHVKRGEDGIPVFFSSHSENSILPFDPLAASFYLVSRYEEYLPGKRDAHDRFPPEESLAFQEGFLQIPVVNHWAQKLSDALQPFDLRWKGEKRKYNFFSTIDIDNMYAYIGKGGFRTVGGFAKDLLEFKWINARQRMLSVSGLKKDPYDTFDLQRSLAEKYGVNAIYFLLFSEFGQFDRNIPMYSRLLHEGARRINDYFPVGIHPSYGSNQSIKILDREVRGLREVLRHPIVISRQHFLKMEIPQTFRNLVELEITDDFSMGYASQLGFRAGICTPYKFYDLELETELQLTMHPFCIMDGTLLYYQNTPPEDAFEMMKPLVDAVKAVNGEMISVWHNRIFSEAADEWHGWNEVYENLLKYARE